MLETPWVNLCKYIFEYIKDVVEIIFFKMYTFEELKWQTRHFILSKWQSFTDLYEALRADSNLQWSK